MFKLIRVPNGTIYLVSTFNAESLPDMKVVGELEAAFGKYVDVSNESWARVQKVISANRAALASVVGGQVVLDDAAKQGIAKQALSFLGDLITGAKK